ncbi:fumarylacetoacetate hydrolase family protein [Mesorhizobium sp. BR1-1-16]|uniref:2-keto-4-pentenoate hydratase n=1 Tax=Mesorhizobium sp. BR1-1-16 TaxID=2876653 RepID=UPI001CCDB4D7|nr:fumarylacetoacetate hydrolase family protein [Mesorhizobium sp. BR1-1-16]MBZ9935933.1 fumarylacetoacetate hydrolase family protein [Mesorhizobium sp. BR1-1-16]
MPIEAAASILAGHRLDGTAVVPLHEADRPADMTAAYQVQDRVHERLASTRFGRRIGWKIGCTTQVMQTYLGIDAPCAAGLFAGTRSDTPAQASARDYRRIGIECEIAVRLAQPLDGRGGTPDLETVAASIDSAMAAIEIVDDRYADWRTLGAPTLVADDFFAAGCVLGRPVARDALPDLAAVRGTTMINGEARGRGIGADVLGHPFAAVAWLAASLATRGRRLEAGEIVLTGSLVETRWLDAGDTARIEIDGLGTVALTVD